MLNKISYQINNIMIIIMKLMKEYEYDYLIYINHKMFHKILNKH